MRQRVGPVSVARRSGSRTGMMVPTGLAAACEDRAYGGQWHAFAAVAPSISETSAPFPGPALRRRGRSMTRATCARESDAGRSNLVDDREEETGEDVPIDGGAGAVMVRRAVSPTRPGTGNFSVLTRGLTPQRRGRIRAGADKPSGGISPLIARPGDRPARRSGPERKGRPAGTAASIQAFRSRH